MYWSEGSHWMGISIHYLGMTHSIFPNGILLVYWDSMQGHIPENISQYVQSWVIEMNMLFRPGVPDPKFVALTANCAK